MATAYIEMGMFQSMLRSTLSTGRVPIEEEIKMRYQFSRYSFGLFEHTQRPSYLQDAIEHLEVILRHLPESSSDLPRFLNSLSYMRVSEYGITKSTRALDEAVDLSLRAKEEAVRKDLRNQDPPLYFDILNNLGYAQSHRYGEHRRAQDLDDAIMNGRELVNSASKNGKSYRTGLLNLASRLRMRYENSHGLDDYNEVMQFLNELLDGSSSSSNDSIRPYVDIQLGELAHSKFTQEGNMNDLEDAIRHYTSALDSMGNREEKRETVLRKLCEMHGYRYDKKKELIDGEKVVSYSRMRVLSALPSHPVRGTYLWKHMIYVRAFAHDMTSASKVEELVQSSTELLDSMPEDYEKHEVCRWLFGDLLAYRYTQTGSFDDLMSFLKNADKMCLLHNGRVHRQGQADAASHKISWLQIQLSRISKAAEDNYIRTLAREQLRGYFKIACETHGVPNAAITLWNQQGQRLKVYAEAIEANETFTEDELEKRVQEDAEKTNAVQKAEEERRRKNPWKVDEYMTEFGLRNLDIDPVTKKIVFDMPGVVQDLFGYKEIKPLPLAEFVQQELQLEEETRSKESREGKFPNPALCRICRKLKILVPLDNGIGFRWNPKVEFKPFGNFNQLLIRSFCTVCGLILNLLIDQTTGFLHRKLSAIDHEVQGTAIVPVTLDNGEEVLQVSYGLREVGALRILNSNHWRNALRQSFQVEDGFSLDKVLDDADSPIKGVSQTVPSSKLKEFIIHCDHNHGRQCNGSALRGSLSKQISMLQIDVVDECLVETTSAVRYFALSYVWGNVDMSKTLRSNVHTRLEKGSLHADPSQPLPKTIQDAIALVKEFGERYLWVDAVCIVQDDDDRKQRDIQQMDMVYSKAFATIVALTGSDADAGLPGVRPGTRPLQEIQTICVSNPSSDLPYNPDSQEKEDVRIVATPPTCGLTLDSSKWNSRGWTFQERILSKRCLYFSKDTVYFQCPKEVLDETGRRESKLGPATSTLENPLSQLSNLEHLKGDAQIRAMFTTYKDLVEQYTSREFSFGGDILNAFAGIWAVLREYIPGGILCGLPIVFLDLALLWTPEPPLRRRDDRVTGSDITAHRTADAQKCPSWTWAGFVGRVEFRMLHNDERSLPTPMISSYRIFHNNRLYSIRSRAVGAEKEAQSSQKHAKDSEQAVDTLEEISDANQELAADLRDLGPLILQFEAFVAPLFTFKLGSNQEYLSVPGHVHATSKTSVCRLYDGNGKHCGIIFNTLASVPNLDTSAKPSLIAIVHYGETLGPYLGPKRVEGNIRLFDDDVYPIIGEGSGMVDALVVSWPKSEIAERITVARIHIQAWERARPLKKLVALG